MSTAETFVQLGKEARANLRGKDLAEVIADIVYRIDCEAMAILNLPDGSKSYRCYDGSCVNVNGSAITLTEKFL